MRTKGRVIGVTRSILTEKLNITLEADCSVDDIDALSNIDLDIEIKKESKKRSLDANAYYWVLVTQIARATGGSNSSIHNQMLREYGSLQDMDGQIITVELPDSEKAEKTALESETFHLKPTSEVRVVDGELRRTYLMLKGSHEYDTSEMRRLIDGVVGEAKELGLETMTPAEIERMVSLWQSHANR